MTDKKYKILVVEDDPMLREIAAAVFAEDYEVERASDGKEGLEKALKTKPDLVVTDLMMPHMHGYELCEKLKGPEGVPGVKIIVLSSKAFQADKLQAKKAGADFYLVKPYDPKALLEAAKGLLSGQEPEAEEKKTSVEAPLVEEKSGLLTEPRRGGGPVRIKFWGTRGSCPCPGPSTVRYGGNTACIEVRSGKNLFILECGTGIRELGASLMQEFGGGRIEGHIFLSHSHWDHIQGFPFFAPIYNPRNYFKIYGVHAARGTLKNVFSGSMAEDYFPVPLSDLGADIDFLELDGPLQLGSMKINYHHLNHPGLCVGFSLEVSGRKITYIADHEVFAKQNAEDRSLRRQDEVLVDFARGSDIVIREAQYTEDEYLKKKGWGHSTFDDAVKFGIASGTKMLILFHHDPEHGDEAMDSYQEYCRKLVSLAGSDMQCYAAMEGMAVNL